jgi:hypothetical protein
MAARGGGAAVGGGGCLDASRGGGEPLQRDRQPPPRSRVHGCAPLVPAGRSEDISHFTGTHDDSRGTARFDHHDHAPQGGLRTFFKK